MRETHEATHQEILKRKIQALDNEVHELADRTPLNQKERNRLKEAGTQMILLTYQYLR